MFIERLVNSGNSGLLEQVVEFTARRHRVITENIANIDTPGYRQKDLSVQAFREKMAEMLRRGRNGPLPAGVLAQQRGGGILAHDRNNRSMEQLATDLASNALMHNVAVELLRKQYQRLEMALRERVG